MMFVSFKNNYSIDSAFTLELWVKPNDLDNDDTIFSKYLEGSTNEGYYLSLRNNGRVRFNWFNSGSNDGYIQSMYPISTDRWYHLSITFDGTDYQMYIDGISVGQNFGTISAPASTNADVECLLGAMDQNIGTSALATNYYEGWMDELRIWNKALTVDQIHLMMNQRINNNGGIVRGQEINQNITGLSWTNDLIGYYQMGLSCGDLNAIVGPNGRLRNIETNQETTAPLPYTSRVDGQNWETDNTWTHFNVWDAPNSIGIDNTTPIDWNIVQISHDINSGDKDITVLGLISDTSNKKLSITDPGTPQNELNDGQRLRITHYLKLDGIIDLFGESQLTQDDGSILDVTSSGYLERDQQGTTNLYNYNYWSSPVSPNNASTINGDYSIDSILRDGTTSSNPLNFLWTSNNDADGSTTPKTMSRRWLYSYEDFPENSYSDWNYIQETGTLSVGLGFTMKGSGALTSEQNYVFVGKPNNGTISSSISSGYQTLVGNPYPSAIDANEFILDNIPGAGNGSIDGTIYFWEHYTSNLTHVLEDYEGGYAAYNLTGGVSTVIPDGISGNGTSTKTPGRYIPVGQGYFVTASPTGGNVTFHNDQRVFVRESVGTSIFMSPYNPNENDVRNAQQNETIDNVQRIRLEFTSEDELTRPLLLGFMPDNTATDGFDYGYDALYSDIFPNDMFWMIEDDMYVIQGVGAFDATKQYPLGLFITNSGVINISLIDLENFDSNINVFIYDSLLGTEVQINDSDFQISLVTGNYTDRFYLTFNSTLSDLEVDTESMLVNYLIDTQEIYININNAYDVNSVHLFNLLGQKIQSWDTLDPINSREIRIPIKNIDEGPYILKVDYGEDLISSKKVIIKE